MHSADLRSRQARRLMQVGVALLLYASLEGFAIPHLGSQRVGLSVHTLGALQGVLLVAFGVMWPRLTLGGSALRVAFWCLLYSTLAILAAYTIAAIWGVGLETIRLTGALPEGLSVGSAAQETLIKVLAYSSAAPVILSFALVLWGLRTDGPTHLDPA